MTNVFASVQPMYENRNIFSLKSQMTTVLVLVLNDNYAWKLAYIQDCLDLYSTSAPVQTIQTGVCFVQISYNKASIANFIKNSFLSTI